MWKKVRRGQPIHCGGTAAIYASRAIFTFGERYAPSARDMCADMGFGLVISNQKLKQIYFPYRL